MNAEDLNDICGRAARGAPIDADHVLEIIADLTAARAELADVRAVLAAVDELGRGITIGLARAAEERDAALAAIARVRELCDNLQEVWVPELGRYAFVASRIEFLRAIEGNET